MPEYRGKLTQEEIDRVIFGEAVRTKSAHEIVNDNLAQGSTVTPIKENFFQVASPGGHKVAAQVDKYGGVRNYLPFGGLLPPEVDAKWSDLFGINGAVRALESLGKGRAPQPLDALEMAQLGAPVAAGVRAVARPIGKAVDAVNLSSKSVRMLDPKPLPQRPFHADYPQATGMHAGSKLAFDIDGRPLIAKYVAGRNSVGGVDEGIRGGDPYGIAGEGGLGIGFEAVSRTGEKLKRDVGRYVALGGTRNIFVDRSLRPEMLGRVFAHELGHAIDDLAFTIPTKGIEKELLAVYEQLNTPGWFKPGRGMTPEDYGYKGEKAKRELIAEAIRANLVDPNYIKTVAPNTAARIREYVNPNPNLNKVIQFNSLGGGVVGGGLLMDSVPDK